QAGFYGMVKERGMHGFPDGIVAAKGEGNVADAAADAGTGQVLLDPFGRADEIHRIIIVLLDAGSDRQHVRVEDDVLRGESNLLGQDAIAAPANLDFALERV